MMVIVLMVSVIVVVMLICLFVKVDLKFKGEIEFDEIEV